jgi:hypothetical protein
VTQEGKKLLMPVTLFVLAEHFTGRDVESREQCCDAVSDRRLEPEHL